MILLPPSTECCARRHTLPHLFYAKLGTKFKALHLRQALCQLSFTPSLAFCISLEIFLFPLRCWKKVVTTEHLKKFCSTKYKVQTKSDLFPSSIFLLCELTKPGTQRICVTSGESPVTSGELPKHCFLIEAQFHGLVSYCDSLCQPLEWHDLVWYSSRYPCEEFKLS